MMMLIPKVEEEAEMKWNDLSLIIEVEGIDTVAAEEAAPDQAKI